MDPKDSGAACRGLSRPRSAAAALPSLRPQGRALPRRPQLQAFDLNPPWTQPPLATASCRCRVPRRPALRPARPPGRRGPLSDDHTWASTGPLRLTSGNPDLPPPPPAHVPKAATTHQLSPSRAPHRPLTFKGLRVLCPPGQSQPWMAQAAQLWALLWALGSCCAQRSSLFGKPAGLVREGRLRRPLEKGATLCTARCLGDTARPGPGWGPERLFTGVSFSAFHGGPSAAATLVSRSCCLSWGGGWGAGVVCWAAWGTGSPPGAVTTPRQLWARRGHAAAPGLPCLARPAPRQEPGGPVATVSGRSSRLLSAAAKPSHGRQLGSDHPSQAGPAVSRWGAGGIPVWPGLWLLSQGMGLQMQTRGPKAVRPARASRTGPTQRTGPWRWQDTQLGVRGGLRLPHEAHRGGSTPLVWEAGEPSTVCP